MHQKRKKKMKTSKSNSKLLFICVIFAAACFYCISCLLHFSSSVQIFIRIKHPASKQQIHELYCVIYDGIFSTMSITFTLSNKQTVALCIFHIKCHTIYSLKAINFYLHTYTHTQNNSKDFENVSF